MNSSFATFTTTFALLSSSGMAGQNAAPSSHLVYDDASFAGDILINEVRVPKKGEAMFTYYEALGWSGKAGGYAGIQAHPKGHNYIFSIWDHKAHSAPIRAAYRNPGTLTEKFGGEGTGLKSWNFELGWDTDVWYTLVARSWPVGDHTFCGFWVRSSKTGNWTHMVTMDVAARDAHFQGGNDSFIEDWLETGDKARTTHLRNGWKRKPDGEWHAFAKARYSVNEWDLDEGKRSFNHRTSWNAGVAEDEGGKFYFMTSGGADTTATCESPSTHAIARTETKPGFSALKITSATSELTADGKALVSWEIDPKGGPQFGFSVIARDQDGNEVFVKKSVEPHIRQVVLDVPKDGDPKSLRFEVSGRDIFDSESAALIAK